jgi:hypothetical protein
MSNKYLLVTRYSLLKASLLFNCHTFFRSPSVNLLKREQSRLSLKMKRFKAGMSNDFLLQILEASAA